MTLTQPWTVDADDPRAPPQDVWDRMSEAERAHVVASLPSEVSLELHPPEGDRHRKPTDRARDALDAFFRRIGRKVYVSSELATYYPAEAVFCPDVLAVLDVEPGDRSSWIVQREAKGLDFVLEIHVSGSQHKDFELNVARYARLGIAEYFVFDRPHARLVGYRLAPGARAYERLVPQAGRFSSSVLGLDLTVGDGTVRFHYGTAPLPFLDELVDQLKGIVDGLIAAREDDARRADEATARADEATARAKDATARADEATARAEAFAAKVAALEAENERLRRGE